MLKTSLPVKVLLWNFNQEAIAMPENINYLEKVDAMVGLRGLTKGTHTYYLSMCRRFLTWCNTMSIDPGEISYEQVQQYVFHLIRDVKYAPKTVNSNISFIRSIGIGCHTRESTDAHRRSFPRKRSFSSSTLFPT